MRNADGTKLPRMYRFDTEVLGRSEYVMLTNEQYVAVLVVEFDQIGTDAETLRLKPLCPRYDALTYLPQNWAVLGRNQFHER